MQRAALSLIGIAAFLLCVYFAALGPDSEVALAQESGAAEGGWPRSIELTKEAGATPGTVLRLERPARKILPANAGTVDYLSLLVDPERVVAVPSAAFGYSRIDEACAGWDELPRFEAYSTETVLSLGADLVVTHGWQDAETTAALRRHGIDVVLLRLPASWEEVLAVVRLLGRILGAEERAAELLDALASRAGELRASSPEEVISALSYSNLGAGGWAAGKGTTADILFGLAGYRNAAAEAGYVDHVQLELEALLALDPDLIVVGTTSNQDGSSPTRAYLESQPVLRELRAVRTGRIVNLHPRLFTTSSIELLTGAEELARAVRALAEGR